MERKLAMNTDILLTHFIPQKKLCLCITLDLECIVLLPKETLIINSRRGNRNNKDKTETRNE